MAWIRKEMTMRMTTRKNTTVKEKKCIEKNMISYFGVVVRRWSSPSVFGFGIFASRDDYYLFFSITLFTARLIQLSQLSRNCDGSFLSAIAFSTVKSFGGSIPFLRVNHNKRRKKKMVSL